ncbi:MAG TPA: hypothetical protein VFP84_36120, partial [Kofleriaceae bacterium]|nr:hypothetical protein [Kofleriaceae bacterium]
SASLLGSFTERTRADGGAIHDDRGQPVRVKGKNAYAEHYECAACGAAQVQCGTRPMMARAAWEAEAADRRASAEAALHAARTPLPAARAVKLPRSSPRPISSPSPGDCPPGPRRA